MLNFTDYKLNSLKAKLFRGFADPSRLGILEALRHKPLTVGQILEKTGLSQSNASNHLSCLHGCGLVHMEQKGRFGYYSLSDERVDRLLEISDELLAGTARRIYECTRYNTEQEG